MPEEGSKPLDYSSPRTETTADVHTHWAQKFFLALLLGLALSFFVWWFGWDYFDRGHGTYLIFLVPGVKILPATGMLFYRRWRPFAAGLLLSVALGGLILIGSCFAHFRWH